MSLPLEANGQTAWLIDAAFPGTDTSDFVGSVRCDAVGEPPVLSPPANTIQQLLVFLSGLQERVASRNV